MRRGRGGAVGALIPISRVRGGKEGLGRGFRLCEFIMYTLKLNHYHCFSNAPYRQHHGPIIRRRRDDKRVRAATATKLWNITHLCCLFVSGGVDFVVDT